MLISWESFADESDNNRLLSFQIYSIILNSALAALDAS